MNLQAYIRREAALSALINAVISAAITVATFGCDPIPVWGVPGFVADGVPQGFMVGLMAALVPGLLARRPRVRARFGVAEAPYSKARALRLALATGAAGATALTALSAILVTLSGHEALLFGPGVAAKILMGAVLGGLVTRNTLRRLLA